MTTIKLDPGAALLLDALHGAGHAAYAVGGCVRDSLLAKSLICSIVTVARNLLSVSPSLKPCMMIS